MRAIDTSIGLTLVLLALTMLTVTLKSVTTSRGLSLWDVLTRCFVNAQIFLAGWWFVTIGIRSVVEAF